MAISQPDEGQDAPAHLCHHIAPVGMLSYGVVDAEVVAGLEHATKLPGPTAIILDSGSTDSGPGKLTLGYMSSPRSAYERDLRKLIKFGQRFKVPLIVSSAGGDGADEHVDELVDIIRELAEEPENSPWKLKVLAIYSGVRNDLVTEQFKSGTIVGCGKSVPALTQDAIDRTPRIVAQMGYEPFVQAMLANPDFNVIIGGRAYDPAPYQAWCVYNALKLKGPSASMKDISKAELGAFSHCGKLLECGGQCATPKSISALATVYQNATFDVVPLDKKARCTSQSVATHALYENARPDVLLGPGGHMDLNASSYEQLQDGRSVRVSGTIYKKSRDQGEAYKVKLEGGMVTGFRTIFIGSFIDPILIGQLDTIFGAIKGYINLQHQHIQEHFEVGFHVYGLGDPSAHAPSGDNFVSTPGVFVVGEILAANQKLANSVASTARIGCIHVPYFQQRATAGNFGFGIGGKFDMEMGECTEFSLYHLMPVQEGQEGAFRATSHEAGKAEQGKIEGSGLFHFTETIIGKGETPSLTNGVHVNGTSKSAQGGRGSGRPTPPPAKLDSIDPRTLKDIALYVRSKNAGPFDICVDVVFETQDVYQLVRSTGLLSQDVVARLYNISVEEIVWSGFYDAGLSFKTTFARKRNGKPAAAGGFMENDMHASQHHVPLLEMKLSDDFREKLAALREKNNNGVQKY